MAKYDPLAKRIGRLKPLDFVKFAYPKSKVEEITFEDREFEFTHKNVDLLLKVKSKEEGEFYFHLEFQGNITEKTFLERMLVYSARIMEEFGKPVKTMVIFLRSTKEIRELPSPMKWSLAGEDLISLNYTKFILPEENWKNLLKKGMEAFLPLIPLTKIPKGEEKEALKQTIEKIERIKDPKIRQEFAALFYVVGQDNYEKNLIETLIGGKLMAELLESKTLQSFKDEGKIEKSKELMIELLEHRFKKLSKKLKDKIALLQDQEQLDSLYRHALKVYDLTEFEKLIDSPNKS